MAGNSRLYISVEQRATPCVPELGDARCGKMQAQTRTEDGGRKKISHKACVRLSRLPCTFYENNSCTRERRRCICARLDGDERLEPLESERPASPAPGEPGADEPDATVSVGDAAGPAPPPGDVAGAANAAGSGAVADVDRGGAVCSGGMPSVERPRRSAESPARNPSEGNSRRRDCEDGLVNDAAGDNNVTPHTTRKSGPGNVAAARGKTRTSGGLEDRAGLGLGVRQRTPLAASPARHVTGPFSSMESARTATGDRRSRNTVSRPSASPAQRPLSPGSNASPSSSGGTRLSSVRRTDTTPVCRRTTLATGVGDVKLTVSAWGIIPVVIQNDAGSPSNAQSGGWRGSWAVPDTDAPQADMSTTSSGPENDGLGDLLGVWAGPGVPGDGAVTSADSPTLCTTSACTDPLRLHADALRLVGRDSAGPGAA